MSRLEDWLLRVLGSVLGLAAIGCGGAPAYGSPIPMYGAPYADYHLKGTVTDVRTGAPIPGIRITFGGQNASSSLDGTFTLDAWAIGPCSTCAAKAEDVDGTANGSFLDKEVPLNLVQTAPGSSTWNQGVFEQKDLAIRLDPKP